MMSRRASMSKKLRFEILKRDKFTCCYCGRKAPDVVLHVDHVVPVAKGGGNDPLNLIAACSDCNGGKSDRELSNAEVIEKRRVQAEQLQDRINAAKELAEWQVSMASMTPEIDAINKVMNELSGSHLTDQGKVLVRKLLKKYPFNDVIGCVETALEKDRLGIKEFGKALEFECKKIKDERDRPGISAIWQAVYRASKIYGGPSRDNHGKYAVVDALWAMKTMGHDPDEVSDECCVICETWNDYVSLVLNQYQKASEDKA